MMTKRNFDTDAPGPHADCVRDFYRPLSARFMPPNVSEEHGAGSVLRPRSALISCPPEMEYLRMRALIIDPYKQLVAAKVDVGWFTDDMRAILGGPPERKATFPNGDGLYVAANCCAPAAFLVTSLSTCPGFGLIVGPRGRHGEFKRAKSRLETVRQIISFQSTP